MNFLKFHILMLLLSNYLVGYTKMLTWPIKKRRVSTNVHMKKQFEWLYELTLSGTGMQRSTAHVSIVDVHVHVLVYWTEYKLRIKFLTYTMQMRASFSHILKEHKNFVYFHFLIFGRHFSCFLQILKILFPNNETWNVILKLINLINLAQNSHFLSELTVIYNNLVIG